MTKKNKQTHFYFAIILAILSFTCMKPAYATSQQIKDTYVTAMQLMATQLSASMEAQIEYIGMMLDAKHQLETQRLFQEKMAEAHKDYHPSEQMCTFGTFARDLAGTERSANLTRTAIAQHILQRETGNGDGTGTTRSANYLSRLDTYRKTFCNPGDNGNGLHILCPNPGPAAMYNRDINYTQTVDQPLSLNINLLDPEVSQDETTVFALVDNLFSNKTSSGMPKSEVDKKAYINSYPQVRSIMAMRGVARNSMANIISLKTATPYDEAGMGAKPYFLALFREFGLTDDEIIAMLGENPSYYAQMEFLTKKIYQNPTFYTNLIDKPANVKRIRAAMRAIKLMQDRDIHAALMRREMLMSMILEARLRPKAEDVYNEAEGIKFDEKNINTQ